MSYRFGNPTVFTSRNFDPVADAQALRKAMKGFGTDEDALIDIICQRTNEQRQIIENTFKTNFGKDLIEEIRSETSGKFEKVLVALLTPIIDYYAKILHDAVSGAGTDETALIEVLCPSSNALIGSIKVAYKENYGNDLESDLISDASGHFKRLLVSLANGRRDESGNINHGAATRDAQQLYEAGVKDLGTNESVFNTIFCQRNFDEIHLICEKYQQLAGHSLEEAIKREFSGDIKNGLLAILRISINRIDFFASCLHESMAGAGTDDNQLIRIIVIRCEIDLQDIKIAFQRLYGKDLRSWIHGDTSGDYQHALRALIGEQR